MALMNVLPVNDEAVLNGLIEEQERRFCERMPRSQWLRREARGVLAGGVAPVSGLLVLSVESLSLPVTVPPSGWSV